MNQRKMVYTNNPIRYGVSKSDLTITPRDESHVREDI